MTNEQIEISNILESTIFKIDDMLEDKKVYKTNLEMFYDFVKASIEVREIITKNVSFRFHENEDIHTLQLRHFLTNFMLWEAFMRIEAVQYMDEKCIFDCTTLTAKSIKNYIDHNIIIPYRKSVSNLQLNKILHDVLYNLGRISNDFNILLGLSINLETFMDVANKNPRFNEIIRTHIDEDEQPSDIEKRLDDLMKEEIQILSTEENLIKPILRCGTGIKDKQLCEFSINVGLKPDLSGNTIPMPINGNFLVGGLRNIQNYYLENTGLYEAS